MKKLTEILKNYKDYETPLDDRFGKRLCDFLTVKQAKELGFTFVGMSLSVLKRLLTAVASLRVL